MTAPSGEPAIALEHIAKRFDDVTALGDASLFVRRGTVHALLGENGAGKTTLMHVAYGMEQPTSGTVRVAGTLTRLRSPADAIAAGIGMVHQHFTLVPAMTVAENVALGHRGRFVPGEAAARVHALGEAAGLSLDPAARVGGLSVGAQQRVELLKALARQARILILDEPTAVLAPAEGEEFLRWVRQLANGGLAVVLITHKLREALAVADDITVLRHGRTTLTTTPVETSEDRLVTAMLGETRPHAARAHRAIRTEGPVITARGVAAADVSGVTRVRGASFDVYGGEIVGVAAIEGSGHRELLRCLARRSPALLGELHVPARVGFVPDDRHRDGLILDMSLAENFALRDAGARRGRMVWRSLADTTSAALANFDVRAPGPSTRARALSGGNQQKFVLARELHGPPRALVVENPSRGLDVQAAIDVQDRLRSARDQGVAIVAYSTDIEETLVLADRMLVVFSGVVTEVPVDRDRVGRAMLGAA